MTNVKIDLPSFSFVIYSHGQSYVLDVFEMESLFIYEEHIKSWMKERHGMGLEIIVQRDEKWYWFSGHCGREAGIQKPGCDF